MEEAVLNKADYYNTGAICSSLKAELYRIDRDVFVKTISSQQFVWNTLIDKK